LQQAIQKKIAVRKKVAYIFSTVWSHSRLQAWSMILPRLEANNHGAEVVGIFFDDNNAALRDPTESGYQRLLKKREFC